MRKIEDITDNLPPMLSGKELISALSVLPEYNPEIVNASAAERLMALSDIYRIYVPSKMSQEIYSKLYLALIRSLQKKCTSAVMQQQRENFKAMQHNPITVGLSAVQIHFRLLEVPGRESALFSGRFR